MDQVHTDFELAFTPNVKFVCGHTGHGYITREPVLAGSLTTSSGHIVVCDPYDLAHYECPPLERTIPPGTYPVYLAISQRCSRSGEMSHHRASLAAKLVFSESPVTNWELAKRVPSEDEPILMADFGDGFQLASGYSCFADAELVTGDRRTEFVRQLRDWGKQVFYETKHWAGEFQPSHSSAGNAVVSMSGDQGGMAYVYVGLDAGDKLAQVVIDFCVLVEDVNDVVNIPMARFLRDEPVSIALADRKLEVWLTSSPNLPEGVSLIVRGDLADFYLDIGVAMIHADGRRDLCVDGFSSESVVWRTLAMGAEDRKRVSSIELYAPTGLRHMQADNMP